MEELKVAPEVLRQNVDKDGKLMSGINVTIKNSIRNEKNLQVLRDKMSKEFRNLSNFESNHSMVSVYSEVAGGFDGISKSHVTYINQVEQKVLPVLNDYQNKIKEVKASLAAYQSKKQALEKQNIAYNRATEASKRDAAHKAMLKAQLEYDQEAMNFTRRIKTYQTDRMTDCKQVLLHTINAEMHYHAKALERLSELAFKVYSIDDKKEAQEMLNQLLTAPQPHPQQNQNLPGMPQSQNQYIGQSQNRPPNSQIPGMGQSQIPQGMSQSQMGQSQNSNIGQSQNRPQNVTQSLVRPP